MKGVCLYEMMCVRALELDLYITISLIDTSHKTCIVFNFIQLGIESTVLTTRSENENHYIFHVYFHFRYLDTHYLPYHVHY
jgi:hypothetical protein